VGDLVRKINQFTFLTCECGLGLKIPPDYKRRDLLCPRCNRPLSLPSPA